MFLHFIDKGDTSIHHQLYISPTMIHFLVLHNICDTIMYNCHSISSPRRPYMCCNTLHNFHHHFPLVFSFLFPSPLLYSACFFLFWLSISCVYPAFCRVPVKWETKPNETKCNENKKWKIQYAMKTRGFIIYWLSKFRRLKGFPVLYYNDYPNLLYLSIFFLYEILNNW